MKTSNKIILSGLLTYIILSTCILLYSRQYVTERSLPVVASAEDNGIMTEKVISNTLPTNTLFLNDSYKYTLDNSFSGIKIKSRASLIDSFAWNTERGLNIEINDERSLLNHDLVFVTYGVQDLDSLNIILKSRAELNTENMTTISYLNIESSSKSRVKINNKGQELNIEAIDESYIDLKGESKLLSIIASHRITVDAMDFESKTNNVHLSGRAMWRTNNPDVVSGILEDNATIQTQEEIDTGDILIYDNAKTYVESWD